MKIKNVLEIRNLSVDIATKDGTVHAVRNLSLCLKQGEILAVVGESGCGKSIMCKSIMRLLPKTARYTSGSIVLNHHTITDYKEKQMHAVRGKMCAMVFQDPMTSLDPTMKIGKQLEEAIRVHRSARPKEIRIRAMELLQQVGLQDVSRCYHLPPWSLSGGMRQRVVLAIALASDPKVLIADEPTTALDVTVQAQILELLLQIRQKTGISILFITHDLGVVAKIADRVAIMYGGKILEIGESREIYETPAHPYTRGLLQALPAYAYGGELHPIDGQPPDLRRTMEGDPFAERNPQAMRIDYEKEPPFFSLSSTHFAATWTLDERAPKLPYQKPQPGKERKQWKQKDKEEKVILSVSDLSHTFWTDSGKGVSAIKGVSFEVRKGEVFALVGESGSGKTTIAKLLMKMHGLQQGSIQLSSAEIEDREREVQMILQDCTTALNQRMKIREILAEPLKLHCMYRNKKERERYLIEMLESVGLDASVLDRYLPQLSGGQRQRVSIARAFAMRPKLLIADEPLASLDVSIQAQIVNLFRHLIEEHGSSLLLIAHDLSMVRFLSDRVGVMYRGELVEVGETMQIYEHPTHPYTKKLIAAIPTPEITVEGEQK